MKSENKILRGENDELNSRLNVVHKELETVRKGYAKLNKMYRENKDIKSHDVAAKVCMFIGC